MTRPFPGAADSEVSEAGYAIVGAPLDASTSFVPGTRFGPDRIRTHAQGFEDYDHRTEQAFTDLDVVDRGNVRPWADVPAYLDLVEGMLSDVRHADAVPIVLGGEHTVSVAGVQAVEVDHVVCFDAHLDLRREFDGTEWSHATAMHHVLAHVDAVTILGARAGAREEWDRVASDPAITAISPDGVAEWLADHRAERLENQAVYLSIDIDAIDPAAAPATGTREPFGLPPETVRQAIRRLAPTVVGCDVVEVNDRDEGETATLAAKLIREFVYQHATHQ